MGVFEAENALGFFLNQMFRYSFVIVSEKRGPFSFGVYTQMHERFLSLRSYVPLNVQLQFIRKKIFFAARLVKSGYKRGGTGMGSLSKI